MTESEDVRRIQRLIRAAAPTLLIQTNAGAYPYEAAHGRQLEIPSRFSLTTNSLVAHALACLSGMTPNSVLVSCPLPDRDSLIDQRLRVSMKNAINLIISEIRRPYGTDRGPFHSNAFGDKDPFTLMWLFELLRMTNRHELAEDAAEAEKALDAVRNAALSRTRTSLISPSKPVLEFNDSEKKAERAVLHPLPLLRLTQLAYLTEDDVDDQAIPAVFEWFLAHLHLQLSRRSIEHSGFDVAELVFCLEGMIVADQPRVTRSILDSVLAALDDARRLNSALRPHTPFKVTTSGAVHLFTSIEVVASLLRSAAALKNVDNMDFFAALKPVLHDYLMWLQETMLRGTAILPKRSTEQTDYYSPHTPVEFVGWQSEHAHTEDHNVHIWLTSQVVLFLRSYEVLLLADIAKQALDSANLRPEITVFKSDTNGYSNINAEQRKEQARREDPLQLSRDSCYRVASRLEEYFVSPQFDNEQEASYSCLLYGPPGTGKTTLARQVASQLGWPVLTITTSDFIIDGEAQVEARAKNIFEALRTQTNLVIFLDEIDRLLLDRNTPDYSSQGDMLQFMTPSMLTKINDLRREERSVFIIATNYADRIDSAIKRAGRIDHKLLVLPPDLHRRREFVRQELEKVGRKISDQHLEKVAVAGVWRTLPELRSAIRQFARRGEDLEGLVNAITPAVSLASYQKRLHKLSQSAAETNSPVELLEEAYLLAYLFMEGKDTPLPTEYTWLSDGWPQVRNEQIVRDAEVVRRLEVILR